VGKDMQIKHTWRFMNSLIILWTIYSLINGHVDARCVNYDIIPCQCTLNF
jgi:hypothetical protein